MAIRNRIFSQCSNVTNTVVLQYNDIFFVPGTIAFYDNQCWTDTLVNSSLTPLADVTFNNYPTCQDCNETNLQGVEIQSYDTSDLAIITVPVPQTPNIGDVVLYDGGCWEVISLTDANLNIVDELNNYGTLSVCQEINPESYSYSAATFVNCCDPSDTQTFNIIPSNFGFPLGNTVSYNGKCYTLSYGTAGTIVFSFANPQYQNCNLCRSTVPCPSPTMTPSNTPTNTPTPSITPTKSATPTPTPTPTLTSGLPPTPSYTTTTTTRRTEVNECEPITLFPLGVECFVTNPTSSTSADGSISLLITGGTGPYSNITWSNGVVGTTILSNLQSGTYSATVIDYYGDFTASTECTVLGPTSSPTPTPTKTPTPTPSAVASGDLCVTFVVEGVPYQFQFNYWTIVNGKPAWTASTTSTPITSAGGVLTMSYVLATLSVGPSFGPEWKIAGFTSPTWNATSPTTSSPPLTGWGIIGSSPNVTSVSVVAGTCPTYPTMTLSVVKTNATCSTSSDGSICITVGGGSGNFVYSIDNGVTTQASNCFYNLSPGNYTVYVLDTTTSSFVTQNVVVTSLGVSSSVVMNLTQVSNQTLINSTNILQRKAVYSLNTSSLPVGVTLNLNFALTDQFRLWIPGDGNNLGSNFNILKNGLPVSITNGSNLPSITPRPDCPPNQIEIETSGATCGVSVVKTDTLSIEIYNKVTITDAGFDCDAKVDNTMTVVGSFTYAGLSGCVVITPGTMTVSTITSKTLSP